MVRFQKLLFCFYLMLIASCSDTDRAGGFELKGNFKNANGETIYLEKLASSDPVVVDSATVSDKGDFEFEEYQPKIGFYRIKVTEQNFAMLVLDSGDKVTVTGDLRDLGNTYKVEGSPETTLFLKFNDIAKTRDQRLDSLNKSFQAAMETRKMDAKRMDSLSAIFEPPYNAIVEESNGRLANMIRQNSNRFSSIMAIQSLDPDQYTDVFRALDSGLAKSFPGNRTLRRFHEMVTKLLATRTGEPAPDITMPSPEGKPIALSSLKGKIVLIDFWASWCGPCRKEMPEVVKVYEKFRNKGFEIYGVSLDTDREKWVQAISSDGLTWPQVSDLSQENEAAQLYHVQAIPYTVLLDREGKILAKNVRAADLARTLEKILHE